MSKVAALVQLLKLMLTSPLKADHISAPPVTRTSWEFTDLPYVCVRTVRGDEMEDLDGADGYYDHLVQVECWHRDIEVANSLREEIKSTLLGYAGSAGTLTIEGVNHSGDFETYDPVTQVHNCLTRYNVVWVATS